MDNYFNRLYDYNAWANGLFSNKLAEINCADEYILKIFSHLHNAQIIWLNRVLSRHNDTRVWDIYNLNEEVKNVVKENMLRAEAFCSQVTHP